MRLARRETWVAAHVAEKKKGKIRLLRLHRQQRKMSRTLHVKGSAGRVLCWFTRSSLIISSPAFDISCAVIHSSAFSQIRRVSHVPLTDKTVSKFGPATSSHTVSCSKLCCNRIWGYCSQGPATRLCSELLLKQCLDYQYSKQFCC